MPVIPQRRFLYFKSYVDTCFFANFAANIRRLPSYPTTRHKKKQMMKKTFFTVYPGSVLPDFFRPVSRRRIAQPILLSQTRHLRQGAQAVDVDVSEADCE